MEQKNYYIPMSNKAFNEIKEKAIELWNQYDNEYGYVDGKVNKIKDLENIGDNGLYIIAMFDEINIAKLLLVLSEGTKVELKDDRLPSYYFGLFY